jgi:hypothetical protein
MRDNLPAHENGPVRTAEQCNGPTDGSITRFEETSRALIHPGSIRMSSLYVHVTVVHTSMGNLLHVDVAPTLTPTSVESCHKDV